MLFVMKNTPLLVATLVIVLLSFVSFNIHAITGYTLRNVGYSVFDGETHDSILEEQRTVDVTKITSNEIARRGKPFEFYVTPGIDGSRGYLDIRNARGRLVRQHPICENQRCYSTAGKGTVVRVQTAKSIHPGTYIASVYDYRINDLIEHTFVIK